MTLVYPKFLGKGCPYEGAVNADSGNEHANSYPASPLLHLEAVCLEALFSQPHVLLTSVLPTKGTATYLERAPPSSVLFKNGQPQYCKIFHLIPAPASSLIPRAIAFVMAASLNLSKLPLALILLSHINLIKV